MAWTIDTALASYPACPLCGSTERARSNLEPGKPGFYTEAIVESLGLDHDAVLGELALWHCGRCATLWYDRWFSPDVVASAYGYIAGRHRMGWEALRNWVSPQSDRYFEALGRLRRLITAAVPSMATYAEVNCPFAGLLFAMLEERAPSLDRRLVTEKISMLGGLYAAGTFNRDYTAPEVVRKLARQLPGPDGGTTRRLLIEEPSPMCWGRSCSYAGANCHAVAKDLLVDGITTFEALSASGERVDAIGLHNVLDHFPDPAGILDKALSAARLVTLDIHEWGWIDAQHHFNIGTGLTELIRDRGHSAIDATPFIARTDAYGEARRYVLCSAVLDLEGWLEGLQAGRAGPAEARAA